MQRSGIEEPHNTDVTHRDCTSFHRGHGTPGVILGAAGNPETYNDEPSLQHFSHTTHWVPAFGEYDADRLQGNRQRRRIAASKLRGIPASLYPIHTKTSKGDVTVRESFLKFERWTTAISMLGACAMLIIASSLGMFQIITRFIIERPAEWTEVMIRFSLIWMVFLGIPAAFRQGAMVSVDVLYRWSPPKIKRVLDFAVAVAALALVGVIIWWGWDYSNRGKVQSIIGLEDVSMFWAYIAMPIGGVFSVIGIIGNLLDPQRLELETAQ